MGWSEDPEQPDTLAIAAGLRVRRTVMLTSMPDVLNCTFRRANERVRLWEWSARQTILDRMERKSRGRARLWEIRSRLLRNHGEGVLELTAVWKE